MFLTKADAIGGVLRDLVRLCGELVETDAGSVEELAVKYGNDWRELRDYVRLMLLDNVADRSYEIEVRQGLKIMEEK